MHTEHHHTSAVDSKHKTDADHRTTILAVNYHHNQCWNNHGHPSAADCNQRSIHDYPSAVNPHRVEIKHSAQRALPYIANTYRRGEGGQVSLVVARAYCGEGASQSLRTCTAVDAVPGGSGHPKDPVSHSPQPTRLVLGQPQSD